MKAKVVLFYNIGDFTVEAEWADNNETVEFWLSRRDYAYKAMMFGLPKSEVPEGKIENVFAEYLVLFCDRGYMDRYINSFLEGDEKATEDFRIIGEHSIVVRDSEAGNVIAVVDSFDEGEKMIAEFETEDKADGCYTESFYEVVQL